MSEYQMVDQPDVLPDGTYYDLQNTEIPAAVKVLHDNMMKALCLDYPAFRQFWHITVDTRGGIVQVRNLALSGDFGFQMKIADIDPEMKKVRRFAGELLERFNVLRGRALSISKAMKEVSKTSSGRLTHED